MSLPWLSSLHSKAPLCSDIVELPFSMCAMDHLEGISGRQGIETNDQAAERGLAQVGRDVCLWCCIFQHCVRKFDCSGSNCVSLSLSLFLIAIGCYNGRGYWAEIDLRGGGNYGLCCIDKGRQLIPTYAYSLSSSVRTISSYCCAYNFTVSTAFCL